MKQITNEDLRKKYADLFTHLEKFKDRQLDWYYKNNKHKEREYSVAKVILKGIEALFGRIYINFMDFRAGNSIRALYLDSDFCYESKDNCKGFFISERDREHEFVVKDLEI